MLRFTTLSTALLGCVFISSAAPAAESIGIVPDSAQALGAIGGRFANLRDASVERTSPSNMLYADRPELLVNASVWNGGAMFRSALGAELETGDPWKYLGSLYVLMPVEPGQAVFGIGVTSPYGLSSSYPRDNALKYLVPYESELLTLDITPAVAFKVTDSVSFGIGLDIMYSKLTLKQAYPWSLAAGGLPFPDGEIKFDGEGWGLGAFAGVTWDITKAQRITVTGRLPLKVRYSGSFTTEGMPAALQQAGLQERSDFNSDITFPGSITAGYGIDVTDKLTWGLDFMWSANHSHDDVPLRISGADQSLVPAGKVGLGWKNGIDLGTGIAYKLNPHWTVRFGYLYSENSMPDLNFTPTVPSDDRHTFSTGIGWHGERDGIDLAYAYSRTSDRDVTGAAQPLFNGHYEVAWHVVTLSYTRKF